MGISHGYGLWVMGYGLWVKSKRRIASGTRSYKERGYRRRAAGGDW